MTAPTLTRQDAVELRDREAWHVALWGEESRFYRGQMLPAQALPAVAA